MSELTIWTVLLRAGMTKAGAAGMMGNMQAESALRSDNVEDRSGIADIIYTQQVDSGNRTKYTFAHDSYGYGLCQWTYYTRKEKLYDFAKTKNVSIADEAMQLEFLIQELKSDFSAVWDFLIKTDSVYSASSTVLLQFENPANASGQINYRFNLSQTIYNKYFNISPGGDFQESNPASTLAAMQASGIATNVIPHNDLNPDGIILDGSGITENIGNVTYTLCAPSMPILKKGDKGVAVVMIQSALKDKGYALGSYGPSHDGIDGDFGNSLLAAINSYKSGHGIPNTGTDQGVVNKEMWESIWK